MKIEIQSINGKYKVIAVINNQFNDFGPMLQIIGNGNSEQEARRDLGRKIKEIISDLTQIAHKNEKKTFPPTI